MTTQQTITAETFASNTFAAAQAEYLAARRLAWNARINAPGSQVSAYLSRKAAALLARRDAAANHVFRFARVRDAEYTAEMDACGY